MNMPTSQALYVLVLVAVFQNSPVLSSSCGTVASNGAASGYLRSPSKDGGGFSKSASASMANYPSNLDCTYDIITPIGTGIKLTWSSFDINGNMPSCSSDYVEIFIGCGRHSIGKYCSTNSQRPFDIYSPNNCLKIKFHSNGNETGTGFHAKFTTFIHTQRMRPYECTSNTYGYKKTGSYGIISSSYWPKLYPVRYGSSCYFKIYTGSSSVKIAFMDFDIVDDNYCDDTKIKIKGGSSGNSYSSAHTTIKNSICGYKTPFTFTTSKDAVFVRFKTGNRNIRRRGFIAGYVLYKPVYAKAKSSSWKVVVGILIAVALLIAIIIICVCKRRKERQRRAQAHASQAAAVPLAPATYPTQPPAQTYMPPPSYGQATAQPYPPPGAEQPPPGSYPMESEKQGPYPPPQGYYPPPGSQPYPPPGGQPYPPPGGQPYPPPGGQPYPPPGGQPYPPPGGQPYPPPGGQPYPTPGGQPPAAGPAQPYPT